MKKIIVLYMLFVQVTAQAQPMHDAYGVIRKGHQGTEEEMKYPEKYLKKNMKVSDYLRLHKDNIIHFLIDSLNAEEDGGEEFVFTLEGVRCRVGPIDTAYSRDLIENYCHLGSPRFAGFIHTSYHDLGNKTYVPFDRPQYDPEKTGDGWERFSYFRLKDMPLCDNCYKLDAKNLFFDRSAVCYNPAEMFQRAAVKQKTPPVAKGCNEPNKYWQEESDGYRYFYKKIDCTDILIRKEKIQVENICNLEDSSWKKSWRDRGIRHVIWYERINCQLTSDRVDRTWFASNWGYFLGAAALGTAGVVAYNIFHEKNTPEPPKQTYTGGPTTPTVGGTDTSYTGGPTTGQLKTTSTNGGSNAVATTDFYPKQVETVEFLFNTKTTPQKTPLYSSKIGIKAGVSFGLDDLVQGKFKVSNFYLFPSRF